MPPIVCNITVSSEERGGERRKEMNKTAITKSATELEPRRYIGCWIMMVAESVSVSFSAH